MNLAFLNIGTQEMVLIVLVALLLFGGKKLPELARGLGRGIREFKDASEGIKREISDQINNFEKEIEEVKADIEKEPEVKQIDEKPIEDFDQPTASNESTEDENTPDKKVPQFTAPSGTYEHKPYTTPTADDYYSYGYNDHFASNESGTTDEKPSEKTPSSEIDENNPLEDSTEDNNTKQA